MLYKPVESQLVFGTIYRLRLHSRNEQALLSAYFLKVSHLVCPLTLKMQVVYSSETLVNVYQNTQISNSEDL